jgi:hypothetical protein
MIYYKNKQVTYIYFVFITFFFTTYVSDGKQQKISIFKNKYNLVRNQIYFLIAL